MPVVSALALSYSEHLGATCGAHTLSCRLAIFHGYALSILHFPFGTAFHTVCLHLSTSLFASTITYLPYDVNTGVQKTKVMLS